MRRSGRFAAAAGLTLLTLLAAACASSSPAPSRPAPSLPGVTHAGGSVNVAFAGTLARLNETIGPEFQDQTGTRYTGEGAAAVAMSRQIASGKVPADVFESIGPYPLASLQPRLSTWSVGIAASPLVVAYSPACPTYGSELAKIARGKVPLSYLFTIMAQPGVTIARSDPDTDPLGQAFYEMLSAAQAMYYLPSGTAERIGGPFGNPKQVLPEATVRRSLQSGKVCLAVDSQAAAVQDRLDYITLPETISFGNPALAATDARYTLTLTNGSTVHGVPDEIFLAPVGTRNLARAVAFISYQLQPAVRAQYRAAGYDPVLPVLVGTGAPAQIRAAVAAADNDPIIP